MAFESSLGDEETGLWGGYYSFKKIELTHISWDLNSSLDSKPMLSITVLYGWNRTNSSVFLVGFSAGM